MLEESTADKDRVSKLWSLSMQGTAASVDDTYWLTKQLRTLESETARLVEALEEKERELAHAEAELTRSRAIGVDWITKANGALDSVAKQVLDEREACAKIAEQETSPARDKWSEGANYVAGKVSRLIRNRSTSPTGNTV